MLTQDECKHRDHEGAAEHPERHVSHCADYKGTDEATSSPAEKADKDCLYWAIHDKADAEGSKGAHAGGDNKRPARRELGFKVRSR